MKYESKKKKRLHCNVKESVDLLKKRWIESSASKVIKGCIQFVAVDPLIVGLWTEKDVEIFHDAAKMYPLVTDATSNVVTKINSKRVFYFAFILFKREVVTSPLPSLEILTDCPDERSLTVMFSSFLNCNS